MARRRLDVPRARPALKPGVQLTPIPSQVLVYGARGADWQRWVDALPGLRGDLLDQWGLDLDGAARHGQCAIVDPVRTGDGAALHHRIHVPATAALRTLSDLHDEVAPLLWNRWGELGATGDVRAAIRTRLHSVVDAVLLDEDRARDWVVIRALVNAKEMLNGGGPASTVRDHITGCVTTAKAVQG